MATITSAGTGNFSAGATWVGGVAPIDGDAFIIAATHIVTVDNATLIPTTGYAASQVNGTLQHASTGISTLRMNGRLTINTGGTYWMRGNAIVEFRGTTSSSIGLVVNSGASTSLIVEGADGMPSTTLSANADNGVTSLSVASATNFAAGEWIAVFDNTTTQTNNGGAATLRDEGFWIHDISGTTIYFRQFVGPTSTITAVSGSTITVANAKVFRVGQKLIFGTGANRNILTISSLNYITNVITLSGSVTGSVVGEIVYETGTDKIHTSGNKVRKVATVTTVSSLSSSNQITVANANMFTAGDEIWVEARSECGGTTDGNWNAYGSYGAYVKTVQSVAGNVITLTTTVGYNVVQGALVTRLTRNVQIRTVTDTDFAFIYFDNYTTNYTRKLVFKDVYCRRMSTSLGGIERGVTFRGYSSTNSLPVVTTQTIPAFSQQAWIEGMTARGTGATPDVGGVFLWDSRYSQARCIVATAFYDGIIPTWYTAGQCLYNSISAGNGRWGMRGPEGGNEWWEISYLYMSRNNHSVRIVAEYEDGCGFHHVIGDANNEYAFTNYNNARSGAMMYKHIHTGTRYGVVSEDSCIGMNYGRLSFLSGLTTPASNPPGTPQAGNYWAQIDRGQSYYTDFKIVESDFEFNSMQQFSYNTMRQWDTNENAWRVYNRYDSSDYGTGWTESIFVPAGATLRISCDVKYAPGFAGNYPYLDARSTQSSVGPNQLQNVGGQWNNWVSGGYSNIQYTAAGASAYETKTLTITPVSFPRFIQTGVVGDNANQARGWWMRPIVMNLDKSYATAPFMTINAGSDSPGQNYDVAASLTTKKNRLGGRIL
jgi:hypothetical protein